MILRETSIEREKTNELVNLLSILAVAIIVPLFHNQLATGPIINAMLFISVIILGLPKTIAICLVPSVIAMSIGLLPPVLVFMVPFIMISNIIMVSVFSFLKEIGYWIAMILASILKFIFLYISASIFLTTAISKPLSDPILTMMTWPQLLTALAGGVLAYFFLMFIKKI